MECIIRAVAKPNEFPWNAFMVMKRADGTEYYCGSTLIYDQWVMTTANCITGYTLSK